VAPSTTAASSSSGALGLHQRNQLARHEGEGDEDGGQHDARYGEDDLDVVLCSHGPNQPCAEEQHVDQAGNHRRHRERQVDQRDQHAACRGNRTWRWPRPPTPNTRFSGTAMAATEQRQLDGRQRVRLDQGGEINIPALAQRLDETRQTAASAGTALKKRAGHSVISHFHPGRLAVVERPRLD
jgi:hypothetical protein